MIDLVIATVAGREESLERCISSYQRNTDVLNIIVVRDEPTCGRAWLKGMALARHPYLHLTCDDIEMDSPAWAEACIETVDAGQLPCPVVMRPDGGLESCGGDQGAPACLIQRMQPDRTVVDFTVLPFMSRQQAERIGMIEAHYKTDAYVSYRGRQLGYKTVVLHDYRVVHRRSNVKRRQPTAEDRRLFEGGLRE